MRVFSYQQGERLAEVFKRWEVEYLFIGKSGAIFYGFPETTQDADIFPAKSPDNGRKLISALRELGYDLTPEIERDLVTGKDFVQLRSGPFDLDLVFAPDGIETFAEAKSRSVIIADRFPVASLDDIIASKRAANRPRDRASLPRLEAFRDYLRSRNLVALPIDASQP
ncbi:MAG: hypothetical protein ONB44_12995 [candidate division KSB1 bacterium]|nr:hypothetical protein [candidate division KSB1 bacterium]MDZ7303037.1 hypothetical protein [candidate division KSB1 bacterium]MDZ7312455.1 hypothetical protein [candidate division KSB1 bacterium]